MKPRDLKEMVPLGERKVTGESNLGDMSEVRVQQFEEGGARYELDEKNRRYRKVEAQNIGPWENLDEK